VGSADRIRAFFGEVLGSLATGGLFINLDYVRLAGPAFQQLGTWAGEDPDAQFQVTVPHMELPATMEDELGWLREAGFAAAECVYREFQTVLVVGIRDRTHWTEGVHQS
jgi:tRNA (cmo5U34)-methyltransferase